MCAVRWMELEEICEGEVGLESAAHILRAIARICFGCGPLLISLLKAYGPLPRKSHIGSSKVLMDTLRERRGRCWVESDISLGV